MRESMFVQYSVKQNDNNSYKVIAVYSFIIIYGSISYTCYSTLFLYDVFRLEEVVLLQSQYETGNSNQLYLLRD